MKKHQNACWKFRSSSAMDQRKGDLLPIKADEGTHKADETLKKFASENEQQKAAQKNPEIVERKKRERNGFSKEKTEAQKLPQKKNGDRKKKNQTSKGDKKDDYDRRTQEE